MEDFDTSLLNFEPFPALHSLIAAYKSTRNMKLREAFEAAVLKEMEIVMMGQAEIKAEMMRKNMKRVK